MNFAGYHSTVRGPVLMLCFSLCWLVVNLLSSPEALRLRLVSKTEQAPIGRTCPAYQLMLPIHWPKANTFPGKRLSHRVLCSRGPAASISPWKFLLSSVYPSLWREHLLPFNVEIFADFWYWTFLSIAIIFLRISPYLTPYLFLANCANIKAFNPGRTTEVT